MWSFIKISLSCIISINLLNEKFNRKTWNIERGLHKDHLSQILFNLVTMAAVTKNSNFFNCPLLLYYKSKWAQILTAATLQWVVLHIIRIFLWNFSFSRFIQIMQIRHDGQLKKLLFLVTAAILNGGRSCRTQFWNGTTQGLSQPNLL
jgi:hypothetical protein